MSSLSYYELTVPLFVKNLKSLRAFFEKGVAHAVAAGESEADYLARALAPDMFPLRRQIQISTDNAKGTVARITNTAPMALPDTEETAAQLLARIDTVIAYLGTFSPEQFAEADTSEVTLPYFPGQYFVGHDYLLEYALPNFFFHVNMAYAIIRNSGVPLGKTDYLGALTLQSRD